MKGGFAAAAMAAMAGGAAAMNHGHGHAHNLFAQKREAEVIEECHAVVETITGPGVWVPAPPPATSHIANTTTSIVTPTEVPVTSTLHQPVPTPEPVTCPTPGTYTFTATTVTLIEETTVCVGSSTHVTSGTHTLGGVTTVVETATTVTCPVATVTTSDGVVTSTVINTEYVCPSAGTYTIAPTTVTVTEECDVDVPVPTVYPPGTYTAPEVVITVTETGFVTVCPYTSSETPTPTPTPEPSTSAAPPPPPPAPSSSSAPPPPPQPEPEPEQEEEDEDEEESSNTSVSFTGSFFSGSFGSDGGHYGLTYTPYDGATGNCKTASQVDDDIAEIKDDGFTVVRVYSTDCDTLVNVGNACSNHGIEMMIGVFVRETGCSYNSPDIKEQIDAIAEWGQFDLVKLFIVGNEALMNGFCSASELAELISVVKEKVPEYTGPYTIAETTNIWLDSTVTGALCDAVDFVGANIHPYFNFETLASAAGIFVQGQLSILDAVCPGKDAVNLECGWPTGGECNGSACPGQDAQAEALESIRDAVGGRTVFFSYDNDNWKEPGACGCEQSWGCRDFFSVA